MMKKRSIVYLIVAVTLLFSLMTVGTAPAALAQQDATTPDTLDTILARAAAKGFLITLTRPELVGTLNFYRLDSVTDDTLAELQAPPVTDFEITESGWVSDVTYQVKAILQPGDREIAVYTGKYDGRWRVESLDLPSDLAQTAEATGQPQAAPANAVASGPAAVSGNGSGKLVFQTHSGSDIYVINADGTGLQRITNGIDPQLSPDGTQIAFTRWEPRYELFTINLDGTNERAWTHGWLKMKSPTWSADGSSLTFSWQNGGRLDAEQVHKDLSDLDQGETVRIPSQAVGVDVEFGILEYTIPADAFWFLKQVNLNTGEFKDLITERHSYGPTGHPNQPNLVIYKGDRGIALHDTNTNSDQIITTDPRDHTPVISPDGSKIAVSYWQDGHWEIHTMNLDGSNRQRLTETPLRVLADKTQLVSAEVMGKERFVAPENPAWNNAAPTWSPDGSQIAFVTDRTGKWEIWLMNADGTNQRPMFSNGALDGITLQYDGVDERMLSWR